MNKTMQPLVREAEVNLSALASPALLPRTTTRGNPSEKTSRSSLISSNNVQADQNVSKKAKVCSDLVQDKQLAQRYVEKLLSPGAGTLVAKPVKFTNRSRMKLLHGAVALERFDPNSIRFVTVTIAGSTPSAIRAFDAYSSYFVRRLIQWVRNQFVVPEQVLYSWCYERQMRGALHLHLAIHVPVPRRTRFSHEAIHKTVRKIQMQISEFSGVDLFEFDGGTWRLDEDKPIVDCQWIRASIFSYMSKRETKSFVLLPDGSESSPTRWGNVSRDLTKLILRLSCKQQIELSDKRGAREALLTAKRLISLAVRNKTGVRLRFNKFKNQYSPDSFGFHCTVPGGTVDVVRQTLESEVQRVKQKFRADGTKSKTSTQHPLSGSVKHRLVFSLEPTGYLQLKFCVRYCASSLEE